MKYEDWKVRGGYFAAPRDILDSDLHPTTKLVFFALLSCVFKQTGRCTSSIAKIARISNISSRMVYRHINELEERGWLQHVYRSGTTNAWWFPRHMTLVSGGSVLGVGTPMSPTSDKQNVAKKVSKSHSTPTIEMDGYESCSNCFLPIPMCNCSKPP